MSNQFTGDVATTGTQYEAKYKEAKRDYLMIAGAGNRSKKKTEDVAMKYAVTGLKKLGKFAVDTGKKGLDEADKYMRIKQHMETFPLLDKIASDPDFRLEGNLKLKHKGGEEIISLRSLEKYIQGIMEFR